MNLYLYKQKQKQIWLQLTIPLSSAQLPKRIIQYKNKQGNKKTTTPQLLPIFLIQNPAQSMFQSIFAFCENLFKMLRSFSNESVDKTSNSEWIEAVQSIHLIACLKTLLQFKQKEPYNIQFVFKLNFQMQGDFRVKNKLSYSPNRTNENVFTMRARIGKKPRHLNPKILLDLNSECNRHFSQSAHKSKGHGPQLFSGARRINSKETYLLNDKHQKESKTKESTSPKSPLNDKLKIISGSPFAKILKSRSSSRVDGDHRGHKDIQRTVSIAIKGKKEDLPSHQKLMTTLSNLILGGQKCQDDFYLQFVGESSIYGQEQNFIQLDSYLFKQDFHLA